MKTEALLLVALSLAIGASDALIFGRGGNRFRRSIRNPRIGKGNTGGGFSGNSGIGGNGPLGADAAGEGDKPSGDKGGGIWGAYLRVLDSDPLPTKAATSFLGFLIGDILAQKFVNPDEAGFDYMRMLRLASFGALIHGPTGHWFYGLLDKKIPGTGLTPVVSKVAIDQILWNPIFGVMFFGYMGTLEGRGVMGTIDKIKNDLLTQVTGSWKVWPMAHAISFRFVPTEQRLLYINTIQIGYNMFLSAIANRGPTPTEPATAPAPAPEPEQPPKPVEEPAAAAA